MMFRLASGINGFEFVRLSSLRAAQLMRGCTARVPASHKMTSTAQREVAAGKVVGIPRPSVAYPGERID
jgi:DNA-directed RNA polymerase subunit K/omega